MHRPSSLRCLLLVVLSTGLRAEEVAPAADALSGAKRDFESISRAHSSPELQKLDGTAPSSSAQNLNLGEPAAERSSSLGGTGRMAKPAKSANWLIDAMTEQKPSPLEELKADASLGTHTSESKLPSATAKPGDEVVNPLTSYMSEWMTPHDLEVLKVKEADGKASMLPEKPSGADTARDSFLRNDTASGAGSSALAGGVLSPDSRSNPYLTELAPGFGDSKSSLVAPAPVPTPLTLPPMQNDLAPVKDGGLPSNGLKATDDAKYFPQLKRF